jgi:carboxypeptidase T
MIILFLLALFDGELTPNDILELERNRMQYPTLAEIHDSMGSIALNYPQIARLDSIGESYEGRQILYLEISDHPGIDEGEAGLFFIGLHHGAEWTSVVVPLFFADSLVRAYSQDPLITWIVDNCRIWVMPCFNVDGYHYSHDLGNTTWRKNRRPYGGSIGTDPNRNYYGGCSGSAYDTWGGQPHPNTSNLPSSGFFCGQAAFSEYENHALLSFLKNRRISACISYHCYGESVSRPWAWSMGPAPDGVVLTLLCDSIARLITCQSGTGHYTSFQQSTWYQICGSFGDFMYGYSRYVKGIPCLPFTIELGTSGAPDTMYLPQICRENFKALPYLAGCIDSLTGATPRVVVAPEINFHQSGSDYTVYWIPQTGADVSFWRLWEMMQMNVVADTFGISNARWVCSGFYPSTQQAHSGDYSIHANYTYDTTAYAVTKYPYLVDPGDTASFWTYYDLEYNGDVAFLEISADGLVWDQVARLTGYQPFWHKRSFPLNDFAGKSLYFRFRLSTDGSDRYQGIYIDDFYPAVNYDSIRVTPPIPDTFYEFTAVPSGTYFYSAQGYNSQGAGIRSQLTRIDVSVPVAEADLSTAVELPILPTIARQLKLDSLPGLKIYNILGQQIKAVTDPGVYFVEREQEITKIILID